MEQQPSKIVYISLKDIKPYENNPRNNDTAVESVANSIREFGFQSPIILDKNNVIICGHTRYKASQKLGLDKVPCIIAYNLTDEQVKAYRLADNKTNELAEWNEEQLIEELKGIADLDMSQFGFDDLDTLLDEATAEDDEYEEPDDLKERVHTGEIWQLGDHRLMCGDSTSERDVERLMNDKQADLLYTDPPYNVNISNADGMTIANDNMGEQHFQEFLNDAFKTAQKSLKEGGAFYVWLADSNRLIFETAMRNNDLNPRQCIIWVKNALVLGRQDYKWKHEPCLYGWKEGAGHYFVPEFNHPTVIEDETQIEKMKKDELIELVKQWQNAIVPTTVIHEKKPAKNDLHPTMKPVAMCGNMIHNSTTPRQIVLDLFGGSGSTLIACEQIGRTCYMMEYDEHYASVIVDRWEKLTGRTAERIE